MLAQLLGANVTGFTAAMLGKALPCKTWSAWPTFEQGQTCTWSSDAAYLSGGLCLYERLYVRNLLWAFFKKKKKITILPCLLWDEERAVSLQCLCPRLSLSFTVPSHHGVSWDFWHPAENFRPLSAPDLCQWFLGCSLPVLSSPRSSTFTHG